MTDRNLATLFNARDQVAALRRWLQRELDALHVSPEHYLRRDDLTERPVLAMLHFLSLKQLALPGYDGMLTSFLRDALRSRTTNRGHLVWVPRFSEIKASWMLAGLGIELRGFEQPSPRRTDPKKTCDLLAGYPGDRDIHFEVKTRTAEAAQWIPDEVHEALKTLKYPATPQLVRYQRGHPIFDCGTHLPPVFAAIQEHIEQFDRRKEQGLAAGRTVPGPFDRKGMDLTLIFRSDGEFSKFKMSYMTPSFAGEMERWLFDRNTLGRDGRPMKPMVDLAIEKGADYLICEGPSFCPPAEIARQCFECVEEWSGRELLVRDPRLAGLRGILFFNSVDRLLIANADEEQLMRLEHVTESPWFRGFP